MTRIRDALVELNPWWKEEFSLEYRDREEVREIGKRIILVVPAYKFLLNQSLGL